MGDGAPIKIFLISFGILLAFAVMVPILNAAFGGNIESQVTSDDLSNMFTGNTLLLILVNFPTLVFWNFSLGITWNLVLMIPRTMMIITLWYIVFPTK